MSVRDFVKKVLLNVTVVSLISMSIPTILNFYMKQSLSTFVIVSIACLISTILSVFYVGFNHEERVVAVAKIRQTKSKLFK